MLKFQTLGNLKVRILPGLPKKENVMKKLLMILMVLVFAISGTALAETILLPNGQKIDLDGLSSDDKRSMMFYIDKLSKAQKTKQTVANTLKETVKDPKALNEWRTLITGTIKDIANDLNVTVNEFVKTPVGFGVAALIVYKVAGKDLIGAVMDVVLIVPFWFIAMGVLFYFQRRFLGSSIVYLHITEDKENKKIHKTRPERQINHPWRSSDAKLMASVMIHGCMVVVTITALLIVF